MDDLRFCQTKFVISVFLILLISVSCTSKDWDKPQEIEALPFWFDVSNRWSFKNSLRNPLIHPFFDFAPFHDKRNYTINFIPLNTPKNEFWYDYDLVSGRRYRLYPLCETKDSWRKYDSTLHTANFTEGIIPRMIDQFESPQRIIVFGRERFYRNYNVEENPKSFRAKVIGGLVEQYCPSYPCFESDRWSSRFILLAVDPLDNRYRDIDTVEQLKGEVDYDYLISFLQNVRGINKFGKEDYRPSWRILGKVNDHKAFDVAFKHGYVFEFEGLKKMRRSCHQLYDYLWFNSLKLKNGDEVVDPKDTTKKYKYFYPFWYDFYKKFSKRMQTCLKYVRGWNINQSIDRNWFFAHIMAFFKLEELGYTYRCFEKAWVSNYLVHSSGKKVSSFLDQKDYCNTDLMNRAFESTLGVFTNMVRNDNRHYRYLTYDKSIGGSKAKIYNWVRYDGKGLACHEGLGFKKDYSNIFPLDVEWKEFPVNDRGIR